MEVLELKQDRRIFECFVIFSLLPMFTIATTTVTASSAYAIENQDFILKCILTNAINYILWERNDTTVAYIQSNTCNMFDAGFASNYRYNCTNNRTYNLIIPGNRISQEDESKWQCSDVGGETSSEGFFLNVARAPTSNNLVTGYGGTILYPGNTVTLTCNVQGGTPLATLSWTCQGISVAGINKTTATTAIIEVKINIDSSYNRQTCVCTATHLLWITDKTTESIPFNVYYPPSLKPVIAGYNGSKLYLNDTVVLTCNITGGNPLATLSWTCDGQNYTGRNRSVVNIAINELTVTMTAMMNGKSCICRGRHQTLMYSKDIRSVPFIVYYAAFESPVITGYISGEPIYTGNKQLMCKVSGGYPLTLLTMTCKNNVISGTNQSTSIESKFIYNIYIDKTYNKQQCVCNGRHTDPRIGYNKNTTVIFNVFFAPDTTPIISGYTNNQIIYEAENTTLKCRVSGGNPLATITWQCRGLSTGGTNQSVDGESLSMITLDINRDYNNKQCICSAVHPAENYNKRTSVTFTVYYPPSSPKVNNLISFPWIEGGHGSLLCLSIPGNPQSSYMWKFDRSIVTEETNKTIIFSRLTKEFNMRGCSCKVLNEYTVQKHQELWSMIKPLNVEYSPVISVGSNPVFTIESKNFTRQCTADGNPIPFVKWIYGDQSSAVLQFIDVNRNQTGNYTCEAIGSSSVYGEFKSRKDMRVVVQYPPKVNVFLSSTKEGQTTNIVCRAKGVPEKYYYTGWTQLYGNTVIRTGLNFGLLSSDSSTLTLTDVSYKDIGVYICTAHNTIEDRNGVLEQQGRGYLDVKFSAVFMSNSKDRFFAEPGHKVEIEIPFFSNPSLDKTSISIIKSNKNNINYQFSLEIHQTSLNLEFYGNTIDVNGQKVVFIIDSFQEDYRGNYKINFISPGGLSSSFKLEVIPSGPPNQPKHFTILSYTTTSITVSWISDFNGGYPQTFVIIYRPVNSRWISKKATIKEYQHKRNYTFTLKQLDPDTEYLIWIYSSNEKGNSTDAYESINPLKSKTKIKQTDGNYKNENSGIIIGLTVGFILGIISVLSGLFVIKWRRYCCESTTSKSENAATSDESNYEELSDIRRNEINICGENQMEGNTYNQDVSANNHYEGIIGNSENTTYETLKSEDSKSFPLEVIYVNTTLKRD